MANTNSNLHCAKKEKNDEFYTTYETVEKELSHYKEQFQGKIVLCNCDDPYNSNFCNYFLDNFDIFGLKRLICTSYCNSHKNTIPTLFDNDVKKRDTSRGLLLDVSSVEGRSRQDILSQVRELKGDGDFRSKECLAYLKICDIVVTNPPFSLFKEFIVEVLKHNKRFLAIGNQNALTYKEIFPLIQNNEVWTGYQFGEMKFRVPNDTEPRATRYWVDESGQKWRSLGNAMWLTNMDNDLRHQSLRLTEKFDPNLHRKYDNYDAIHIRNITEIPSDYRGIMAVPITIINRYNSEQFEIVGEANHGSDSKYDIFKPILNGKEIYKRILIRNRVIASI